MSAHSSRAAVDHSNGSPGRFFTPFVRSAALAAALSLAAVPSAADSPRLARPAAGVGTPLRVVGSLGALNLYTRHEEPFWTRGLAQASGGRYRADIVPADRTGLRAADLLPLLRQGSISFGTLLLSVAAGRDPALGAADLPGLNPDITSLRRTVGAFRGMLEQRLRREHGLELLAVYTYPAQVLFCREPFRTLDDLKGRRIRSSSPPQSDWIEALGAVPVPVPFNEIVAQVRNGNVDCAITGTMSGNTSGLHEATTHLHTAAVNWGLSAFVAHAAAWRALPPDLRTLIRRELPRIEAAAWNESDAETAEGIACNTGGPGCKGGRPGGMVEVKTSAADRTRLREAFSRTVLPRWLARCGPECADLWNGALSPVAGGAAPAAP